jgi:hypothetical protein
MLPLVACHVWKGRAVPERTYEVQRIPLDPSKVRAGSTLRPIARFVAERDGTEAASVVFGRAEIFEREPLERAGPVVVGRGPALVDAANHPMMAAMRRTGADADADPWHKWLYVQGADRVTHG